MKIQKNIMKKAQGLPLNTIVIAILVIIVMLVIIVFFTSKVGESGSTIDDTTNTLTVCEESNPLIQPLLGEGKSLNKQCQTPKNNEKSVPGIANCCIVSS